MVADAVAHSQVIVDRTGGDMTEDCETDEDTSENQGSGFMVIINYNQEQIISLSVLAIIYSTI